MAGKKISRCCYCCQNNPVISNTTSFEPTVMQQIFFSFREIKSDIMEMQGDIAELQEELKEAECEESKKYNKNDRGLVDKV